MRLEGKTAFITAAGAGIGRATALAYAAEGAQVIATDIDGAAVAAIGGDRIRTSQLDVTNAGAVAAAAEEAGAVDILVNCAGYVHHGSILDCDDAAFDFSVDLNLRGAHRVTRALLPGMLKAGGGSLIYISSVLSSIIGAPNRYVYTATKAGLIGLVKAVAADFVAQGIRANAICPGTVETPSWHERVKAGNTTIEEIEASRAAFVARQPMGRVGQPDEIAALAVYLGADESAFVTGQAIAVDGGWSNI